MQDIKLFRALVTARCCSLLLIVFHVCRLFAYPRHFVFPAFAAAVAVVHCSNLEVDFSIPLVVWDLPAPRLHGRLATVAICRSFQLEVLQLRMHSRPATTHMCSQTAQKLVAPNTLCLR